MTQSTQHLSTGTRGEDAAARFLEEDSWEIIARNVSFAVGEIDIVAKKTIRRGFGFANLIAFVEVKTRSATNDPRSGTRAVTPSKRKKIVRASRVYLKRESINNVVCRFDVIAVDLKPEIVCTHYVNAFDALGRVTR